MVNHKGFMCEISYLFGEIRLQNNNKKRKLARNIVPCEFSFFKT